MLPFPLTAKDIAFGKGKIPHLLQSFYHVLYTASAEKRISPKQSRLIDSSCEDVIFNITRGHIKPQKHLLLGMGIKSLTGSKKVVNILNRMGHSISYHVAEELETELAMSIEGKDKVAPDGVILRPGLSTGMAFDNYDENMETLSGANTLHDTVGIVYQNMVAELFDQEEREDTPKESKHSRGERQKKHSLDIPVPYHKKDIPYHKKTKLRQYSIFQLEIHGVLEISSRQDIMIQHGCFSTIYVRTYLCGPHGIA